MIIPQYIKDKFRVRKSIWITFGLVYGFIIALTGIRFMKGEVHIVTEEERRSACIEAINANPDVQRLYNDLISQGYIYKSSSTRSRESYIQLISGKDSRTIVKFMITHDRNGQLVVFRVVKFDYQDLSIIWP